MTNKIKANISIVENCVDPVHMASDKPAERDTHISYSASIFVVN